MSRTKAFIVADYGWEKEESTVRARIWDDERLRIDLRDEWLFLVHNGEPEVLLYRHDSCVTPPTCGNQLT